MLELLQNWFPAMENFEGELKRYKKTINLLAQENDFLSEKVAKETEHKMFNRLETSKLQSEINELHKFIDYIPEDVQQEVKAALKQQNQNRRRQL